MLIRFIISYSFLLLIILALISFIFNNYIAKAKEKYNDSECAAYVSRVELFENYFKIMDISCRQALLDSNIRKIMNLYEIDEEDKLIGKVARESIAINIYADSFMPVKESFFYLRNSDYVLSADSFLPSADYYKMIKRYPADLYDNWKNLISDSSNYNKYISLDNYRTSGENYLLYAIDMKNLTYLESNVTAVFILKKDEVANQFRKDDENYANFVAVFDQQSKEYVLKLSADGYDSFDETLTRLDFKEGYANLSLEEAKLTVCKYKSEKTGYEYYIGFNAYDIMKNSGYDFLIIVIISLLLITLVFALILWMSHRNVQPIIEINEKYEVASEENEKLRTLVDKQVPLIKRSYLRQLLLSGVGSEDECRRICAQLGTEYTNIFNVLYFVVYSNTYNDAKTASYVLSEDLMLYMVGFFNEVFSKDLPYYKVADHSFAILLDYDSYEAAKYSSIIKQTVETVHRELLEKSDLWAFAGLGTNTQTMITAWQSYEQAVEASRYTDKNVIFLRYEDIKKNSNFYYYPNSYEEKLFLFIINGATLQAENLLREIEIENTVKRSISPVLLNFLLSDIRNTLIKARFELPVTVSEETVLTIQENLKKEPTFDSLKETANLLSKQFAYSTTDISVIEAMITYIKSNYTDPLMCLNKISDVFHISEEYFDHLFKDQTGVNFSVYIENLRIAKAMELIKAKKVSVGKAYEAVGYTNPNSFRKAFKKIYGINPSEVK